MFGSWGGRGEEEVVLRGDAVEVDALQCQQSLLENAQKRGCAKVWHTFFQGSTSNSELALGPPKIFCEISNATSSFFCTSY
jgi:hypothetical protein